MKLNLNDLKPYSEKGYITTQNHPRLPLIIVNYTNKTQYENKWDNILLKCRGIVFDSETREQVNNPIPKFFNFSEELGKSVCNFNKPFKILTKYDGSLIQIFRYNDEIVITSRGSFCSDQVILAKEILIEKGLNLEEIIIPDTTYIFELIHPNNRIVCNYNDTKDLILLAARRFNKECDEVELSFEDDLKNFPMKKARKHNIKNIKNLEDLNNLSLLNLKNEEGYVFLFDSGDRCKVKFKEYIKLHKLISNISTTNVWENLSSGISTKESLKGVPDEIYREIRNYEKALIKKFKELKIKILKEYDIFNSDKLFDTDKKFALEIKNSEYKNFFFRLRKGKSIDKYIWKEIKPEYKRL